MPVTDLESLKVHDGRHLLGRVVVGGGELVVVHPGDELRVLRRALLQRHRRVQLLRHVLLELRRRRRLLQRCGRGVRRLRLSGLRLPVLRLGLLLPVVRTLLVGGGRVLIRLLRRRVLLLGQILGRRWRLLLPVRLRRRKALAALLRLLLLLILRWRRRRLLGMLRLLGVLRQVVVGVGPRGWRGRRVVLRSHPQAGRRRLCGAVAATLLLAVVLLSALLPAVKLAAALLLRIVLLASPPSAFHPCSNERECVDFWTGQQGASLRGFEECAFEECARQRSTAGMRPAALVPLLFRCTEPRLLSQADWQTAGVWRCRVLSVAGSRPV